MVSYEFYVKGGPDGSDLIAILPEKRKQSARITQESILKWGKLAAGTHVDPSRIYFVRVVM